MRVFELTKQQQQAFDMLKKYADKCEKLGIGFVNVYGTIHPFNSKYIEYMDVDRNFGEHNLSCRTYGYPINSISNMGGDSFADDQVAHSFKLTEAGRRLFIREKSEDEKCND